MPAWPGGPCPECGDDMPANLIHCYNCRALLNDELQTDSVEIPAFVPLQEIEVMIEMVPRGYYIACPHCTHELKINGKYLGEAVGCKFCQGKFILDLNNPLINVVAYYGNCPHCSETLRIGKKYAGLKVACKHCAGKIEVKV